MCSFYWGCGSWHVVSGCGCVRFTGGVVVGMQ